MSSVSLSSSDDSYNDIFTCSGNSIDLSADRDRICHWVQKFSFKPMELGKHFKKHGGEWPLQRMGISTKEDYLRASRENIVNSIFERGFVVRAARGDRAAFFTAEASGFPNKMTSIGVFDGVSRLSTFYSANGKTPALTIKNFRDWPAYIAYFEKGMSQEGWQIVNYDPYSGRETLTKGIPDKNLHEEIDFLSTMK